MRLNKASTIVWVKRAIPALLVLLAASQLIRPATVNPPIDSRQEIAAHLALNAGTQAILRRACDDCHSNRTVWPWYSYVAPVSWLVASDVNGGRRHMNFSQWGAYPPEKSAKLLDQICKEVHGGDMPPWQYLPMHRAAWLTQADRQEICAWAMTVPRQSPAVAGAAR